MQRRRRVSKVDSVIPPHFMCLGDIAGAGGIDADNAPHRSVINILFPVRGVNPFVVLINDNGGVNAAQAQLKAPHLFPVRLLHCIDAPVSVAADDVRLSIHLSDNRGRVSRIKRSSAGGGYPDELTGSFIKGEIAVSCCDLLSPT